MNKIEITQSNGNDSDKVQAVGRLPITPLELISALDQSSNPAAELVHLCIIREGLQLTAENPDMCEQALTLEAALTFLESIWVEKLALLMERSRSEKTIALGLLDPIKACF